MNYCKDQLQKNDLNIIDEFDAASISWAKKLKRMNPTQAIYADMLINQIVNKGLLNELTNTTVITDQLTSAPTTPFSPYSAASSNTSQQDTTLHSTCLTNYYEQASNTIF